MNVVNNIIDATEIPVPETTKEKPVMSEETKSESVVVVKSEAKKQTLLSKVGTRLGELATNKGIHVMVGNVGMGALTGMVGGAFGPVGTGIAFFGYMMGGTTAIATNAYLLEETLNDTFAAGKKHGALEAELALLRAQANSARERELAYLREQAKK